MPTFRDTIGSIYERLSKSGRQRLSDQFRAEENWPAAILFYHRVADSDANAWTISTRGFLEHLRWLGEHIELISLDELRKGQENGRRKNLQACLTFDDGYHETIENAVPQLIERNIPATFFISTQNLETGIAFPHDAARNRCHAPLTFRDLSFLVSNRFEIGGHTHSHLDLGKTWDARTLRFEIRDSRHKLQDWTGQEVKAFAFPYGMPWNISKAAIDAVMEAGYSVFLSAYGAWNRLPGGSLPGDAIHLKRIHGEDGLWSLRNWLTLDPRKFDQEPEFRYVVPSARRTDALPDTEKMLTAIPMPVTTGLGDHSIGQPS